MNLFDNIQTLCELDGISGREQAVAAEILRQIEGHADSAEVDALGNIIAFKRGKAAPCHSLMLCAHMDEVGLIVTGITSEGLLRVETAGGVDTKVLLGRRVTVGDKKVPGVIGSKGIHKLKEAEREEAPALEKLLLDIGALDREDALKLVSPGDSVHFTGNYFEMGDGMIVAKAIDDRAGCAILIELLQSELEWDTWFCFAVQEEVGGRGAKAGTYTINPDIAVVVESTATGDVAGVDGPDRVCEVGGGAVVSFMDNATIYDRELYRFAFETAKKNGIPCQTKTRVSGGNDAGVIQSARGGVRCMAVSIPSRYIHSPSNTVKKSDVEAVCKLVKAVAAGIGTL